jgi:hypothetical protein
VSSPDQPGAAQEALAPARRRRRGKNRRPISRSTLLRLRSQNWKHGRRAGVAGVAAHYLSELYAAEPGLEAALRSPRRARLILTASTLEARAELLQKAARRKAKREATPEWISAQAERERARAAAFRAADAARKRRARRAKKAKAKLTPRP